MHTGARPQKIFDRYCWPFLTAAVVATAAIWLTPAAVRGQTKAPSPAREGNTEWTVLFDGSDLDAFRGYHKEEIGQGWKIDGDALFFDGSGGGDIVTREEYADFELRFEWKVSEGANSGVMYRVSLGDPAPYFSGPEYQILDDERHHDGKNPKTTAASLYALYAPDGKELKPVGQWNTARIVLRGNDVEHWVNGKRVVHAVIGSDDWNERVAASKFKDWEKFGKNRSGHVCFQDHGDKVWFRNIRVRNLATDGSDR